eukprot:362953-Chlamydomonas_euryale.AAC.1
MQPIQALQPMQARSPTLYGGMCSCFKMVPDVTLDPAHDRIHFKTAAHPTHMRVVAGTATLFAGQGQGQGHDQEQQTAANAARQQVRAGDLQTRAYTGKIRTRTPLLQVALQVNVECTS